MPALVIRAPTVVGALASARVVLAKATHDLGNQPHAVLLAARVCEPSAFVPIPCAIDRRVWVDCTSNARTIKCKQMIQRRKVARGKGLAGLRCKAT